MNLLRTLVSLSDKQFRRTKSEGNSCDKIHTLCMNTKDPVDGRFISINNTVLHVQRRVVFSNKYWLGLVVDTEFQQDLKKSSEWKDANCRGKITETIGSQSMFLVRIPFFRSSVNKCVKISRLIHHVYSLVKTNLVYQYVNTLVFPEFRNFRTKERSRDLSLNNEFDPYRLWLFSLTWSISICYYAWSAPPFWTYRVILQQTVSNRQLKSVTGAHKLDILNGLRGKKRRE